MNRAIKLIMAQQITEDTRQRMPSKVQRWVSPRVSTVPFDSNLYQHLHDDSAGAVSTPGSARPPVASLHRTFEPAQFQSMQAYTRQMKRISYATAVSFVACSSALAPIAPAALSRPFFVRPGSWQ